MRTYESVQDKKTPWVPLVYWNWIITLLWQWTCIVWYSFLSNEPWVSASKGMCSLQWIKMWSRGGDVIFLFNLMSCSIKFSPFFFTSTFLWTINRGCNYCWRERGQTHSFACGEGLRGQGEASKQSHRLPLSPLFRDEKLVSTIHQEKAQQMKLAPYLSGVREVHLLLVGSSVQNCPSYAPRAFLFLVFQSLKWCNHLECSTREDTEHKPQKTAARKEVKEGRNIQENDAPSPTHTCGQPAPAPRVSEKVTGLHACCSHGAEWRTH